MKGKITVLFLVGITVSQLCAQTNPVNSPALKLDLPLFELPYQIDAAGVLEYGFFESYTHPSMDAALNITGGMYSAFHFGMKQLGDFLGTDTFWKRLLYYGGIVAGDTLLYILPVPTGYMWMHESFHRAVFTHSGLRSHINYDFPVGAYCITESGSFLYWYDVPRSLEAGIESEYLLVEKTQRNNFFYNQNLFNESLYWIANLQAWSYAYMPFLQESMTMNIEGEETAVATDSLQWVHALFHPQESINGNASISLADLPEAEKTYLENRVWWSLVNLASPMILGIQSIPLGADSTWYGNIALRQYYTSFGTDLSVNVYLKHEPFNMVFTYHNYLNYERYFFSLEAELLDFPIRFTPDFGLLISPRIMIGMQPRDQVFMTALPEFFGLLGLRLDFVVTALQNFLPYLEFSAKTAGWVAGNEFLESNVSVRAGLSMRF